MTETDVTVVLGTRPEIIKLSPVIRACEQAGIEYSVIHTGQHYSDSLDSVFFDQLELPTPEYHLGVGSGTHGKQTAEMLAGVEEIILEEEPEIVLVQGDTNSVLAGALATSKLNIELGHIEAGLRSFDRSMPEETNRVVTDHVGDYLFTPTAQSAAYLREEGITDERIYVTGNTVVDAVKQNRELAQEKSTVREELGITGEFALLTAHRAENVDDKDRFRSLLSGVGQAAVELDMEVIYPIHPRAKNKLEEFELDVSDQIRLVDPQDYIDFLTLESTATVILTDSGGVQEEACILGVPCVTLRENTERPETLEVGANRLVGTNSARIVDGAHEAVQTMTHWENPFGDGTAAEQMLNTLPVSGASEVEQ
ncbi:UDP-N-acetylglucosamine 2-epimerase (non-hydrolyzing) [Halorubrum ezzemoulense]|uniref:UDP-N-acetylglucosamine 2-epimerase (Non-hydrolyzing) n=1 Tax=Halorubrum ezzemoulense TaxID=337243 RepID=A0A256IU71_HALEZ|nr:UDP-N-acetylglucosamine 2-epimerase (non-hydrolyzing) [Halorubrum ezzemoulense]OYR60109.1 UDP-N-acetylglucosamine 2-epimerase (non-hydrolyzing) [Halorubrum ezzemoulense]